MQPVALLLLAVLQGTVTGREGRPVPRATVAASPFEGNLDTLSTTTNAAGEYSFDLWITEFSDADQASLVAPRPLFIESGTLDTAAYFKDSFIE